MAADPTDDRPPLTGEDLDRIRARLTARANLGIDPESPAFLDAIAGSIFLDLEGPAALELDEFYDFAGVIARAVIPIDSYGVWLDDWAESFGLARRDEAHAGGILRFTGTPGTVIAAGREVTTAAPPDGDPFAFQVDVGGAIDGTGSVDLAATAVLSGSAGNVQANTLTLLAVDIDGVTGVTNPSAMTGGADVESDEQLSARVREALSGDVGSGTQADYRRWGLSQPGVGYVTVRPAARGAGTVDVFITDTNNDPSPPSAVAELQATLDPVAGQGLGLAPIGHDVLVRTPATLLVTVAAGGFVFEPGYSLDGAGGTTALRQTIIDSVTRYVNGRGVGDDVIHNKVIAAIVDVRGVANFDRATLTLNGVAADLAVADVEVAAITAVNLA